MKKFTDDVKGYSECWDDEPSKELIADVFNAGGACAFMHTMEAIGDGDKKAIQELTDYFKKQMGLATSRLEAKH